MIKKLKFPKLYFGWGAVAVGAFMNFWGTGLTVYGFSALFKPLSLELGFTRAATSVASSISRYEGAILSPLEGWFVDRFGPKWLALFGVVLFALGLALMYRVNTLWGFYLVWGVIVGLGHSFVSGVTITKAIGDWFVKKRGLAYGIRMAVSGVVILPLISWAITVYGWRLTYLTGGIVMALVGLPLVWFFIRQHRPEYYGLLPDGATVKEEEDTDVRRMIDRGVRYAAEVEEIEFTLKQVAKTPAFWLLLVARGGFMVAYQPIAVHMIPFLTDIGMGPVQAATTITIGGLFGIVARFSAGVIADRLRKGRMRLLYGGGALMVAAGMTLIVLKPTIVMAYPFFILLWVGFGFNMILASMILARYFGRKVLGSVQGISNFFAFPLSVLSPIYVGWVYDNTGSYIGAFTLQAIVVAVAGLLMLLTLPPKPPSK